MRGDFLQGAGGCQSGCFQAFDDSLDLGQASLEGVDRFPQFSQLLSEDFALAAFGSHDGYPSLRQLYRFFPMSSTRLGWDRLEMHRDAALTPPPRPSGRLVDGRTRG